MISQLGPLLARIDMLDEKSCLHTASQVKSLNIQWESLGGSVLKTLGSPLYRNANLSTYFDRAAEQNPRMWNEFSGLYQRISHAISEFLGQQLHWRMDLAFPGFHIIDVAPPSGYQGGGIHFDLSHCRLSKAIAADSEHFSFTLPVELPGQTGTDFWDVCVNRETELFSRQESLESYTADRVKSHVAFNLGQMVLFNGAYAHRIGSVAGWSDNRMRITLQGHVVLTGGCCFAFW